MTSLVKPGAAGSVVDRLFRVGCVLSVVCVFGGSSFAQEPQQPEQPKFETSAEVVLVDVTVVSGNGEPVTGLTADDFKLIVNGQPRAVHTVQFISSRGMKAPVEAPRLADVSSNDNPSSGRLLLFVIDENYLRVGGARAVLQAADRVMETLAPGDLVGLARLPTGRGGVEFTTNRERIRRALSGIMGGQPRPTDRVRLGEAHAFDTGDMNTWSQVLDRECGQAGTGGFAAGFGREACINEVEAQARNVLTDAAARTRVSINGYEQLATRLAAMKAPVNIVLISEGLYVGRDRNDLTHLAELAARARTTFFVVQPDESMFDMDTPRTVGGLNHEALLAEGLEQLAGLTRGSYFKVATSGAGVFDRISRELSGYYLLSFEPTDADRTSRNRRIRVEVGRRDLTVKSRSTYALADSAAAEANAALPPEEQVKTLLGSPMPTAGLPMRVATYSVTNTVEDDTVRVILAAEIGEAATNSVEWPVGILVFDQNDKVYVDTTRFMTLSPATDRGASPRLLTTTMALQPGEYSLRLASIDHEGRLGSVHHTIDARLHRIAGNDVRSSDLIISSEVAEGGAPRPIPSAIHYSETMYSIIELIGRDGERVSKSRVTVQIAESDSSPALITADAQPIPRSKGQRAFAALLRLGVLPPGEYVARAVVKVPGQPDALVTRSFRLAPIALPTDESPIAARVSADEAPAPLPMAKVAAPVARFAIEDVLQPAVVQSFLDFLQREHPVSAEHQSVLQQARDGVYMATPASAPEDEVTLAFIRGLGQLQKQQYAQAAAWFQLSLKHASDFLGAAVYLGAVHAAAGRDVDAIGAWQMATISDDSAAVYPMLVDALLRIGDAQGALDMIAESPEAWATVDARLRRVATAQAMLGQFEPALEALTGLLQRSPADQDLLFVAIQVLYRQHLARPLEPANRTRFDDYAQRYVDGKGPEAPLVQTWRRYVMR
ncbi:MAG TPA: VWA domain-containing protein [Vicinamibacterales bacterium]|nr:VWA domain-containing protein [Vicinamibacterales bacterium]